MNQKHEGMKESFKLKIMLSSFYSKQLFSSVRKIERGRIVASCLVLSKSILMMCICLIENDFEELKSIDSKFHFIHKEFIISIRDASDFENGFLLKAFLITNFSILGLLVSLLIFWSLYQIKQISHRKRKGTKEAMIFIPSNIEKFCVLTYSFFINIYSYVLEIPSLWISIRGGISPSSIVNMSLTIFHGLVCADLDYSYLLSSGDYLSRPYSLSCYFSLPLEVIILYIAITIDNSVFKWLIGYYVSELLLILKRPFYHSCQQQFNFFVLIYFLTLTSSARMLEMINPINVNLMILLIIFAIPLCYKISIEFLKRILNKMSQAFFSMIQNQKVDLQQLNYCIRVPIFDQTGINNLNSNKADQKLLQQMNVVLSEIQCTLFHTQESQQKYDTQIQNTQDSGSSSENQIKKVKPTKAKQYSSFFIESSNQIYEEFKEFNIAKNSTLELYQAGECIQIEKLLKLCVKDLFLREIKTKKMSDLPGKDLAVYFTYLIEGVSALKLYWIYKETVKQKKKASLKEEQILHSVEKLAFIRKKKTIEDSDCVKNPFSDVYSEVLWFESRINELFTTMKQAIELKLEILQKMKMRIIELKSLMKKIRIYEKERKKIKMSFNELVIINCESLWLQELQSVFFDTMAFSESDIVIFKRKDDYVVSNKKVSPQQRELMKMKKERFDKTSCVIAAQFEEGGGLEIKTVSENFSKVFPQVKSRKDAIGKKVEQIIPGFLQSIHKKYVNRYLQREDDRSYGRSLQLFASISNMFITQVTIDIKMNIFEELSGFGLCAKISLINSKRMYIIIEDREGYIQGISFFAANLLQLRSNLIKQYSLYSLLPILRRHDQLIFDNHTNQKQFKEENYLMKVAEDLQKGVEGEYLYIARNLQEMKRNQNENYECTTQFSNDSNQTFTSTQSFNYILLTFKVSKLQYQFLKEGISIVEIISFKEFSPTHNNSQIIYHLHNQQKFMKRFMHDSPPFNLSYKQQEAILKNLKTYSNSKNVTSPSSRNCQLQISINFEAQNEKTIQLLTKVNNTPQIFDYSLIKYEDEEYQTKSFQQNYISSAIENNHQTKQDKESNYESSTDRGIETFRALLAPDQQKQEGQEHQYTSPTKRYLIKEQIAEGNESQDSGQICQFIEASAKKYNNIEYQSANEKEKEEEEKKKQKIIEEIYSQNESKSQIYNDIGLLQSPRESFNFSMEQGMNSFTSKNEINLLKEINNSNNQVNLNSPRNVASLSLFSPLSNRMILQNVVPIQDTLPSCDQVKEEEPFTESRKKQKIFSLQNWDEGSKMSSLSKSNRRTRKTKKSKETKSSNNFGEQRKHFFEESFSFQELNIKDDSIKDSKPQAKSQRISNGVTLTQFRNQKREREALKRILEKQNDIASTSSKKSSFKVAKSLLKRIIADKSNPSSITMFNLIGIISFSVLITAIGMQYSNLIAQIDMNKQDKHYSTWPIDFYSSVCTLVKNNNIILLLKYTDFTFPSTKAQNTFLNNTKSDLIQKNNAIIKLIGQTSGELANKMVFKLLKQTPNTFQFGQYYNPSSIKGTNAVPGKYIFFSIPYNTTLHFSIILSYQHTFRYAVGLGTGRPEYYMILNNLNFHTAIGQVQKNLFLAQEQSDKDLQSELIIVMVIIITVSALCLLVIIPLYGYVQKQRQIVVSLFATFSISKIEYLQQEILNTLDFLKITFPQSAEQDDTKIKIQQKSHEQRQSTKSASYTTELPRINIQLIIKLLVAISVVIVYPISNKIISQNYLSEETQSLEEIMNLYQLKGYIAETISLHYNNIFMKLHSTVKPIRVENYIDSIQELLDKSDSYQSQLQQVALEELKHDRYNQDLYSKFFFSMLHSNICSTLSQYPQFISNSTILNQNNCINIHKQILKYGFQASFKEYLSIFPDLQSIYKNNNTAVYTPLLKKFCDSFNLIDFSTFEVFLEEVLISLRNFSLQMSDLHFDYIINILELMFLFQIILLTFIFSFGWLILGLTLKKQLYRSKRSISIIDMESLLENTYVLSYLKKKKFF